MFGDAEADQQPGLREPVTEQAGAGQGQFVAGDPIRPVAAGLEEAPQAAGELPGVPVVIALRGGADQRCERAAFTVQPGQRRRPVREPLTGRRTGRVRPSSRYGRRSSSAPSTVAR
ncbi:hypothetical protein [Actinacidiphila paucisporea]|uniref:hypothetical protein n=1 Tax=Actinacidiphila paucisporea TaxID=310782 RepID=UPI00116136B7|nr:hypothetical protein [Actinacidiphila paucisporea]